MIRTAQILVLLCVVVASQCIVRLFLSWQHRKFSDFFESAEKEGLKINEDEKLESRLTQLRGKKLKHLSLIVGTIEIIFFGVLIMLLLQSGKPFLDGMSFFFKFLGGWLAIKTVNQHGSWSSKVLGKPYFYVSLFGMLINVSFAFYYIRYFDDNTSKGCSC